MSWCIALAVPKGADRAEQVLAAFRAVAAEPYQSELARTTIECLGELAATAVSALGTGAIVESSGHLDVVDSAGNIELRVRSFNVLEAAASKSQEMVPPVQHQPLVASEAVVQAGAAGA